MTPLGLSGSSSSHAVQHGTAGRLPGAGGKPRAPGTVAQPTARGSILVSGAREPKQVRLGSCQLREPQSLPQLPHGRVRQTPLNPSPPDPRARCRAPSTLPAPPGKDCRAGARGRAASPVPVARARLCNRPAPDAPRRIQLQGLHKLRAAATSSDGGAGLAGGPGVPCCTSTAHGMLLARSTPACILRASQGRRQELTACWGLTHVPPEHGGRAAPQLCSGRRPPKAPGAPQAPGDFLSPCPATGEPCCPRKHGTVVPCRSVAHR